MLAALATTLFFAVTPVFANRAAGWLGSTRANFWRLAMAGILLGAWAHVFGRGLQGQALGWFVGGGVVGFGLGGLAMFQALPRVGSNLANLIVQCGSAIAAAIVEWVWLHTHLSAAQIGFGGLTLLGITIGLWPGSVESLAPASDGGAAPSPRAGARQDRGNGNPPTVRRAGLIWAVVSAVAQGVGAVMSRKAFATAAAVHEAIDPGSAAYQRALGGIVFAGIALLIVAARGRELPKSHRAAAPWVLANAVTGPVLGVTCYQWALRTTPAGIVQPIVAAAPLLTIPFAARLEGSRVRPAYAFGVILAVAGVSGLMLAK